MTKGNARVALAVGVVAALLSATIWLSLLGAPLGVVGLILGVRAMRNAQRQDRRSWAAIAAVVLSGFAILALPFFMVACSSWIECV